jgi:RNA polymerase sigma-70 factor (ECF subfamily)
MGVLMSNDPGKAADLFRRAGEGDAAALGQLLDGYRKRLRRMVRLRLDPRLQGRLDASDVLQEAYLEATRRLAEYLRDPKMPFFLWLRYLTGQKLLELRRRHLGTQGRDAGREISLYQGAMVPASSSCLAAQLLGKITAPLQAAIRAELKRRLQDALNGMEPLDREVLALRHFEQLDNTETAGVLGITPSGASSRYLRALKRLKQILSEVPGFFNE